MARKRGHDVTIREGTKETYWYVLAGYGVLAIIELLLILYLILQAATGASQQSIMAWGATVVLWYFVLSLAGLITYPALFKDAAYLRGVGSYWNPEWWRYLLIGIGPPIALVFVGTVLTSSMEAFAWAAASHGLSAGAMCVLYLYRRHEHYGVP